MLKRVFIQALLVTGLAPLSGCFFFMEQAAKFRIELSQDSKMRLSQAELNQRLQEAYKKRDADDIKKWVDRGADLRS